MKPMSRLVRAIERVGRKMKKKLKDPYPDLNSVSGNSCVGSVEDALGRSQDDQQQQQEEEELGEGIKNKSLPLSTLIELLKQKTGKEDIDVGKLRPTLFDIFGEDASAKVKKFMNFIFGKIKGGGNNEQGGGAEDGGGFLGMVGGLAQQFLQQKLKKTTRAMPNLHCKPLSEARKKHMPEQAKEDCWILESSSAAAKQIKLQRMRLLQATQAKLMVL